MWDEIKSAATTASSQVNKVLSGSSVASGIKSMGATAEQLKSAALNGVTNLGSAINSLVPGTVAGAESALKNALNGFIDLGKLADNLTKFKSIVEVQDSPPFPNTLHNYSSYNYIFTLSVLDDTSLNFPDKTYKQGLLGPLILRSAGGAPNSELVQTAYGKYDFFLDNVRIAGVVGLEQSTGNTNSTSVSFKITEMYSMGLFFQAVQTAALQAGHENYLDVPLLLTIEFKGHVDPGLLSVQIDKTTKHIPLKLRDIGMRVTGKGCEYDVEAYPWNEAAYSMSYSQLKTDANISCDEQGPKTVQAMLQTGQKSLQRIVNDKLKEEVKRKDVDYPNQVLILFPGDLATGPDAESEEDESGDEGATVNPRDAASSDLFKTLGVARGKNTTLVQGTDESQVNPIGRAGMGFTLYNKGDTPFAKDNLAYDEATGTYKRGNIVIDPKNSDFKFAQGMSIPDVINQVILMSDYGRNALKSAQLTPEGQVVWWRVETHLYNLGGDEVSLRSGVKPKLIVYRVVPYLIDASVFLPPNAQKPGLEEAKKQALKEYNYIYTGKNLDILDFAIEFKAGFYRALHADGGNNSEGEEQAKNQGGAATSGQGVNQRAPEGESPTNQQTPQTVRRDSVGSKTYALGGGGFDDAATIAARQFHDIATNGVDMINLNMKILGDPYYIADSGMGNYSAQATNYQNITADGGMDYQSGEVYITVNFRTPVDINQQTGYYNFGGSEPLLQFSGLYRVLQIESVFNRGKFEQTLSLVRIPGQDNPDGEVTAPKMLDEAESVQDEVAAIEEAVEEEGIEPSSMTDEEIAANNASLGNFEG